MSRSALKSIPEAAREAALLLALLAGGLPACGPVDEAPPEGAGPASPAAPAGKADDPRGPGGRPIREKPPVDGARPRPAPEVPEIRDPLSVVQGLDRLTASEARALERDTDGDGLPDLIEIYLGGDPEAHDSDFDGVPDGLEWALGLDLAREDTDGDGLPDGLELELGTRADHPDSDGDGFSDGVEWAAGSDPLDAASVPPPPPPLEEPSPLRVTRLELRLIGVALRTGRFDARVDYNGDGVIDETDLAIAQMAMEGTLEASFEGPRDSDAPERAGGSAELPGGDPCQRSPLLSGPLARFLNQPAFAEDGAPLYAILALKRQSTARFNAGGCDTDGDGNVDQLVDADGDGVPEGLDLNGDGRVDRTEGQPQAEGARGGCCYEPVCEWVSSFVEVNDKSDTGLVTVAGWTYDESRRRYERGVVRILYSSRDSGNCLAPETGPEMSMESSGVAELRVNLRCARPEGSRCERPCRACDPKGAGYGNYHSQVEVSTAEGFTCWPASTNRAEAAAADAVVIDVCGSARPAGANVASGSTVTISRELDVSLGVGRDADGASVEAGAGLSFGESRIVATGSAPVAVRFAHEAECFPLRVTVSSAGQILNQTDNRAVSRAYGSTEYASVAGHAESVCMPAPFRFAVTGGFDPASGRRLREGWQATR